MAKLHVGKHSHDAVKMWLNHLQHNIECHNDTYSEGLVWVENLPHYAISAVFKTPKGYILGTKLYRFYILRYYGIGLTFSKSEGMFKKAWEEGYDDFPDNTPRSGGGGIVIAIEDDF